MAGLLALICDVYLWSCHFSIGILNQVWCLIVSIPDLSPLSYLSHISGIMALTGTEISGDVYAWTAVFVLPINSALNPFLYTLSAIIGKKVSAHNHRYKN